MGSYKTPTVGGHKGFSVVYTGIVGGDMNAIVEVDENLPERVGLRDL